MSPQIHIETTMTSLALLRLAMLWGLLCIVLTEILVGRSEMVSRLQPEGYTGKLRLMEEQIIQPATNPRLLVFGTSRARGAFLPTRIEQQLGFRRGAVLNLSLAGANISDATLTYERSRQRLRGAEIVVLQVDAFQFNSGLSAGTRFRRYASWDDRQAYSGAAWWSLTRDFIFRTAVALQDLGYYSQYWLSHGSAPTRAGVDAYGRLAVVSLANNHNPWDFRHERMLYWLDTHYESYHHSEALEQSALRLMTMAHEDGARVYVVRMPTVRRYRELFREVPGDPYGHFRSRVEHVFGAHADAVLYSDLAEDAGLTDQDFRDWGHLNLGGAKKWSDFFSDWLMRTDPVLREQSGRNEVNRSDV